jgi:hypothetical protein
MERFRKGSRKALFTKWKLKWEAPKMNGSFEKALHAKELTKEKKEKTSPA